MLQEPLFQKNILATILRNFDFYLFGSNWLPYALGVLVLLSLTTLTLKLIRAEKETYLFPSHKYTFNRNNNKEIAGLIFCFISISLYSLNIFLLDDSLFNNYDLMSSNTTFIFNKGVTATYGEYRLNPISGFDLNILYAITHNFLLINFYTIIKQAFIMWLLYQLLTYIPAGKRLFLIGILTFLPTLFWINNIIFPEQIMLIFILSSFLCLRNYTQNGKFIMLWLYALLTSLAVYTKETVVVFYAGILAYNLLYYVFQEKINFSNLFRPWRLAKLFPFECITSIICFSFAIFYFYVSNTMSENYYISIRLKKLPELCYLYRMEIFSLIIAWSIFIKKIIKKETFTVLLNEGFLWGATAIILFLLFILKISAGVPHTDHKSYYAVLSTVFSLIYIAQNLSLRPLSILFVFIFCWSIYTNYYFYHKENGIYYHQIADFINQEQTHQKTIVIAFPYHKENLDWIYETWSSAFMYYFPDKDITFKFPWLENAPIKDTNMYFYRRYYEAKKLTKISPEAIVSGDYYILKKNNKYYHENKQDIQKFTPTLVFENKIFEVYKLK